MTENTKNNKTKITKKQTTRKNAAAKAEGKASSAVLGKGKTGEKNRARATVKSTARSSKGARGSKKKMDNMGIPMRGEVQIVASFGIMLLLMLSNFGWCGMAGRWLSSFFFGVFGCVQYVMPIAFFLTVTILIANDYSTLAMKKSAAGFVLLLMIAASSQLIYHRDHMELNALFSTAIRDHRAGGILGGGIGMLLQKGFGIAGAAVIIFCIMLLSLIMLTQRSFVGFFRTMAARGAKGMDSWKEKQKQEKERRKLEEADGPAEEAADGEAEEPEYFGDSRRESIGSFLKMKNRKRMTRSDKRRAKQCEEKLKEIEEGRKKGRSAGEAKRRLSEDAGIRVHVPTFTSSEEVKKKDAVREIYPEIYPFTAEDARTKQFDGTLDFTAFSFNSGQTPEEFAKKLSEDSRMMQEMMREAAVSKNTSQPEAAREIVIHMPEELSDTEEKADSNDKRFAQSAEEEKEELEDFHIVDELPESSEPPGLSVQEQTGFQANQEQQADEKTGNEAEGPKAEEIPENGKGIKMSEKRTKNREDSPQKDQIRINRAGTPKPAAERKPAVKKDYIFPPMSLLVTEKQKLSDNYDQHLKETALKLQSTLNSFGVKVTITDISCGPTVTRYEMFPEQGTKVSKILSLTDDIKLNLAAADIRIEAPIPGKAAIGIEVPNKENMTVHFRELIDNRVFRNFKSKLAFAVGKDIGGKIVVADLAKMPHLLIAGATGSGKSVCINTLIMSILYKASPEEVRLIMIDPKMVELSTYNGIPHLLIPVVTDPKKASGALNWAVTEMTDRYKKFTECNVRNIEGYNKKVQELIVSGEADPEKLPKMSQIVIIIDELADLMMVSPGEVEDASVRLSQLARAAGIHLVIATQRPSVNVITGLIKANVPSRIAFSVSSGVDSRTIIDMNGAEKLLGRGDMLFYPAGYQKPVRVQGAFISDGEVANVVEFLKENESAAVYDNAVSEKIENKMRSTTLSQNKDEYFEAAARFIMEKDKATIGMLQRMFKIGFNRAARIIDQLAEAGIVGPEEGTKPRKILMTPEQLDQYLEETL